MRLRVGSATIAFAAIANACRSAVALPASSCSPASNAGRPALPAGEPAGSGGLTDVVGVVGAGATLGGSGRPSGRTQKPASPHTVPLGQALHGRARGASPNVSHAGSANTTQQIDNA